MIGVKDLDHLKLLEPFASDSAFREKWQQAQHRTKERLVNFITRDKTGVLVDPSSMFDVMVKRIHEYKRQHLAVLHIITLYHRIKQNPNISLAPRACLFGGKAAPGYRMAKLIIKLVNSVGEVVNNDPRTFAGGCVRCFSARLQRYVRPTSLSGCRPFQSRSLSPARKHPEQAI